MPGSFTFYVLAIYLLAPGVTGKPDLLTRHEVFQTRPACEDALAEGFAEAFQVSIAVRGQCEEITLKIEPAKGA